MDEARTHDAFAEARDQQKAWKHREFLAYAVALVRAGIACQERGTAYFGSDDVPEHNQPGEESPGIPGCAAMVLRNAGVINDYYGTHREATPPVIAGRRRSKRESAHGRKVQVYQLAQLSVVNEWLKRNGESVVSRQAELALV